METLCTTKCFGIQVNTNIICQTADLYVSTSAEAPSLRRTRSPRPASRVPMRRPSLRWRWWWTGRMWRWASLLLSTAKTPRRPRTARGAGSSLLATVRWSAFSRETWMREALTGELSRRRREETFCRSGLKGKLTGDG